MMRRRELLPGQALFGGVLGVLAGSAGCGSDDDGDATFAGVDCEIVTPISAAGTINTGYAACENGVVHRVSVQTCGSLLPRTTTCSLDAQLDSCSSDADCTEHPNGFCGQVRAPITMACGCAYGCLQDADCGAGEVCKCAEPVGECIPASCVTDDDCGDLLCVLYPRDCGMSGRLACESPADECLRAADCAEPNVCAHNGDHASCTEQCVF
jgi:hypothetical protein